MHTNSMHTYEMEGKMATVKNQFMVGLEGCERKEPWW